MIEITLSQEQEKILPEYMAKYKTTTCSTKEITLQEVTNIVSNLYQNLGKKPPKQVYLVNNPTEALNKYQELTNCTDEERENEKVHLEFGSFDSGWIGLYKFLYEKAGVKKLKQIVDYEKILNIGWCLFYEECAIVSKKPKEIHVNEKNQFHRTDGPAIIYEGLKYYSVRGVDMTDYGKYIEDHSLITAELIINNKNQEIRAVLLELMGLEKFIEQAGATLIHQEDFRGSPVQLYRIELKTEKKEFRNTDIVIEGVLVTNKTKEPDNTYKKYFITVQPNIYHDAVEALASTFIKSDGNCLTKEEYKMLEFES